MLDAPIPADEALRLADLCALDVLDSAPEWRFDRITQMAQKLLGVPIALVSLVDCDRQWFKSHAGLDATETPRNISFCGHAIHHDRPFVIPDATQDPRFADNPLVTGPLHLRLYAGVALRSVAGRPLGTLCVIGREPRQLSDDELALLTDLAAWAERELNLRELQQASEAAEQAGRRLRVVLDSATDAILAVDESLDIHTFNRSAEQMFGLRSRDMIGASLHGVLPPDVIAQLRECMGMLMSNHQLHGVLPSDLRLISADGTPFHADIRVGRTEIRGLACFTLIIRDVSEQHELDAMKAAFVATVSHELRTPLTSIRGALKLLQVKAKAAPIGDGNAQLLDIAEKNCARLGQMVNDLLDLERMDCGKLSFDRKPQALSPLARDALRSMQPYADSFGVSIALRADGDGETAASSIDEGRITQVLVNLLSNAIKFSPRGAAVQMRIEPSADRVRISVADQGSGIPEEFRQRIFQRFAQAGGPRWRGQAGSGLGLAICKMIVEQHDGQIGFDTRTGAGSTFYVDLPRADAPAGRPAGADAKHAART